LKPEVPDPRSPEALDNHLSFITWSNPWLHVIGSQIKGASAQKLFFFKEEKRHRKGSRGVLIV
jgi:hypothetical protein